MPVPMIKELSKLRDEALRMLELYTEHKDSEYQELRRKVHVDLDRWLMEHREEAILLIVDALNEEIQRMIDKTKPVKKVHMLSRIMLAIRRRKETHSEPVVFELHDTNINTQK